MAKILEPALHPITMEENETEIFKTIYWIQAFSLWFLSCIYKGFFIWMLLQIC